MSLRGLSTPQPWPSSSDPWSFPPGGLGSLRGWNTELQGMGLSQRVRDKQGWWGGVVGTLLSLHPIFNLEEKENI